MPEWGRWVGIGVVADTPIDIGRAMAQAAVEPNKLPHLQTIFKPPVAPGGLCFAQRY
jgi:hypothetical protein